MPPIINSEATKIDVGTQDVFIEVTAIDEHKANIVLNMLIANFSVYTNYTVHAIKIIDNIKNETRIYPNINEQYFQCELEYLKSLSGIRVIENELIIDLLTKMGMRAELNNGTHLDV